MKVTRTLILCLAIYVSFSMATLSEAAMLNQNTKFINFAEGLSEVEIENGIANEVNRISKTNFARLYRSLWDSKGMQSKLTSAVNKAFDEQTKDLMWGTAGFQLATNRESIIENIQDAAAFNFAHDYDDFMTSLETSWNTATNEDIRAFYANTLSRFLRMETSTIAQAWLRQDYEKILSKQGDVMIEALQARLTERHPELTATASAGVTIGLAGLAGILLRKKLTNLVTKHLGKRVLGRAAAGAIPVVNMIMLAWGTYDIVALAWDAKDTVRQEIQNINQELYTTTVPENYWGEMEPYVKEIFMDSYREIENRVNMTRKMENTPQVIELSRGLNDIERQEFAERVAIIVREFGGADYEKLLQEFGVYIRNASQADFQRLMAMFKQLGLQSLRAWFRLAGNTKCYHFYENLPTTAWNKFPPTDESLRLLTWITWNLTPSARVVACELPPTSIQWCIEELPERYISRLFKNGIPVIDIETEIDRLSLISDKDSRRPWMGAWDYFMARHKMKFYTGTAVVFLCLIFYGYSKYKSAAKKRKTREYLEIENIKHDWADLEIQRQQRGIPQIQSPYTHAVQLWVTREVVPDMFKIQGANIQEAPNGEFTVYFNDINALACWIFCHRNGDIRITDNSDTANALRATLYNLHDLHNSTQQPQILQANLAAPLSRETKVDDSNESRC